MAEQRKIDLLKGNPFKLSTNNRAKIKNRPLQQTSNEFKTTLARQTTTNGGFVSRSHQYFNFKGV